MSEHLVSIGANTEAWEAKPSEMWASGSGWSVDSRKGRRAGHAVREGRLCWAPSSLEDRPSLAAQGPYPWGSGGGRATRSRPQSSWWPRFTSFQPKIPQMSWEKASSFGFHVCQADTREQSLANKSFRENAFLGDLKLVASELIQKKIPFVRRKGAPDLNTAPCNRYLRLVTHLLGRVRLFATPWTAARQAPLSMGFPSQEYWSGLPFLSPGDLLHPGIEPGSPALQADSLLSEPPGKIEFEAWIREKRSLSPCLLVFLGPVSPPANRYT